MQQLLVEWEKGFKSHHGLIFAQVIIFIVLSGIFLRNLGNCTYHRHAREPLTCLRLTPHGPPSYQRHLLLCIFNSFSSLHFLPLSFYSRINSLTTSFTFIRAVMRNLDDCFRYHVDRVYEFLHASHPEQMVYFIWSFYGISSVSIRDWLIDSAFNNFFITYMEWIERITA